MNKKRFAVVLSYLNLVLGMIVNIFLTPFLIYTLGDLDYSMYKIMQSFSGTLGMFHFGISTIVTRSVVFCHTSEEYTVQQKENTLALAIISSVILCFIILIVAIYMYFSIPTFYGETFDFATIKLGQKIFLLFVFSTLFHMLTDVPSGCIIGYEKYTINSTLQICKTVFKLIMITVFVKLNFGVLAIATVDLLIAFSIFLYSSVYVRFFLNEKPKLHSFDKKQIFEILTYGLAIFMQAFVNQINNNVDTIILGAFIIDKTVITMYSSALSVYTIYNSLISVISTYFLPNATRLMTRNASGEDITNFVVKPGRFQATIACACIFGFILFGKDFIVLWIGKKYINAYWIILMLMIPVTIPLVENAMISILDASMKRIYRSFVLIFMAILNILLSLILVKFMNFWGATIGTMLSLMIGHGFLMNYYYWKNYDLKVVTMFISIFKGILPVAIITSIICIPLLSIKTTTWTFFIFKCCFFVIIYLILLLKFGLNKNEKDIFIDFLKESIFR